MKKQRTYHRFRTPKQKKNESDKAYVKRIFNLNKDLMKRKFYDQEKSDYLKIKHFLFSVKNFKYVKAMQDETLQENFKYLFNSNAYTSSAERFQNFLEDYINANKQELIGLLCSIYGYYIDKGKHLRDASGNTTKLWNGEWTRKRVSINQVSYMKYKMHTSSKNTNSNTYYLYVLDERSPKGNNLRDSFVSLESLGVNDES